MIGAKRIARVSRAVVMGCALFAGPGAALAAPAADDSAAKLAECLAKPKGAAPPGERWRYRVERGTKRHCWYTRGGSERSAVTKRERPAAPAQMRDVSPPVEPLQLSVANARAEAGVAASMPAEQQATPSGETARNPAWTLADRWSQTGAEAAPAAPSPRSPPTEAPLLAARPAAPATEPDESPVTMIAVVMALLGLSAVLAILLKRRREVARDDREAPLPAPVTDLNDRPFTTWRKGVQDDLRRAAFNPVDAEVPPRRRTTPPAARA